MKVIDPGHIYSLSTLDGGGSEPLKFVKRMGDKYPGNLSAYPGTTIQEVCRALIDRLQYVNAQIPDKRNDLAVWLLRRVIWLLEDRASERHGRGWLTSSFKIEELSVCPVCGHIKCHEHWT